ncbi:MAG: Glycine oxidase [Candidatus Angelobacter sp.]|nr:Glycine oxidase [Candidatus Angelobacter sp.]
MRSKTWDAIIIGGGIIGVSLALELRHHGAQVLVVERGEPGREASHAGAGMLAALDPETPAALREMARVSAAKYPEFIAELKAESGMRIDFRRNGTIYLASAEIPCEGTELSAAEVKSLEPGLECSGYVAYLLAEDSVDPRELMAAALEAAKRRGVEIARGSPVTQLTIEADRVTGVRTTKTGFASPVVVNCCGAWAGEVAPITIPTRPVKGQLLSVVFPQRPQHGRSLEHVVRGESVYLVPRSDGRILIGATVEEAGFDKRVDTDVIQQLQQAAAILVPEIGEARIHDAWAGLRPGSPDGLPIMGKTSVGEYFAAAGHYRNGILLAPATAMVMSRIIRGADPEIDVSAFSPSRFPCDEHVAFRSA